MYRQDWKCLYNSSTKAYPTTKISIGQVYRYQVWFPPMTFFLILKAVLNKKGESIAHGVHIPPIKSSKMFCYQYQTNKLEKIFTHFTIFYTKNLWWRTHKLFELVAIPFVYVYNEICSNERILSNENEFSN